MKKLTLNILPKNVPIVVSWELENESLLFVKIKDAKEGIKGSGMLILMQPLILQNEASKKEEEPNVTEYLVLAIRTRVLTTREETSWQRSLT